jgi:asparagine synthase (glutamine-hydrolysing)
MVLAADASCGPHLVADWDACFIDETPVTDLATWVEVLRAGRLGEVEGAFALAWRSLPDDVVHLARDAVGERTLYYTVVDGNLAFASSVAALSGLEHRPPAIDPSAVAAYLSFGYIPGHRTLLDGISELLPGEVLHVRDGSVRRDRLWATPGERQPVPRPSETTSLLRARLTRAVRRRLPDTGPVGASLSGGIDSSLIVALASRMQGTPVLTYSITFGRRYPDELAFSSLVARHCRTNHRVIEMPARLILSRLDATIACLSKPIGDPLTVPNALLFQAAAEDTTVLLNGEGGDPCFGGPKNLPMLIAELYSVGPDDVNSVVRRRSHAYLRAHNKCYDDLDSMLTDTVKAAIAADPPETIVAPLFADTRPASFINRLMAMNVTLKGGHHILPQGRPAEPAVRDPAPVATVRSWRGRARRAHSATAEAQRLGRKVRSQAGRHRPPAGRRHRPAQERHARSSRSVVRRTAPPIGPPTAPRWSGPLRSDRASLPRAARQQGAATHPRPGDQDLDAARP